MGKWLVTRRLNFIDIVALGAASATIHWWAWLTVLACGFTISALLEKHYGIAH